MSSKLPRIAYGFLSQSVDPINMKLPWQASVRDGLFKMNYKMEDAVIDELRFWAKTNKGEYIMDTNFGLDIRRYLFDPIPVLKDNVLQNANEQLPIYFPKIRIVKLEILTADEIPEISRNAVIFKFDGVFESEKTRDFHLEETIG